MFKRFPLHNAQFEVLRSPATVKVVVAGRGFGKSWLMLVTAILFCIDYKEPINPESPQVALICMPTLKMAKSIFLKPLLKLLEALPLIEKIDKSEFRFSFKGERPDLILRGADLQGERLRGLNLCFAGLDEYQGFDPNVWEEILDPALSRNENFKALVIGTPKGKLNHFYKFHLDAIKNEDWQYWHFNTKENPFFPIKHLRRAFRELPARVYRQEFQASFEAFEGQIASEADRDRHFVTVEKRPGEVFYIGIDPGVINPAMSLIGLGDDHVFTFHDSFYEPTGEAYTTDDLLLKCGELISRNGVEVKRIFIPDDRADLVKTFRQAGYSQAVLVKRTKPSPLQRAEILNTLLKCDKFRVSAKQPEFFDELLSYHRDTDREGQVVEAIAPNQVDHRIDSALYTIGRLTMDYPILLPLPDSLLPKNSLIPQTLRAA